MTFKKQLYNFIHACEGNSVPYDRVMRIVDRMGHKRRTAERMLNPSRVKDENGKPLILTNYNAKGQISSYQWVGKVTERNWWDNGKRDKAPNKLF